MSRSRVIAYLGSCPPTLPTVAKWLKLDVRGSETVHQLLSDALVPVVASYVRVCRYVYTGSPQQQRAGHFAAPDRLQGPTLDSLTGSAATQFERETNTLKAFTQHGAAASCDCSVVSSVYFLTFASDSQWSSVTTPGVFGSVANNGVRTADADQNWLDWLQLFTTNEGGISPPPG
ncbi:MAG: hypothetical protein ACLPVY_24815 [Acidimicrobiia bacterium]